jgi:hypothetical protein
VWSDSATGLLWERAPAFLSAAWATHATRCSGLTLAGLDGWRLPLVADLTGLFTAAPGPGGCYWNEAAFGTTCWWGSYWADPGTPPPFGAAPVVDFQYRAVGSKAVPSGAALGRCMVRP